MTNLYYLRITSNMKPSFLSRFLNVTAHTYLAFEKQIMIIPPEIVIMLSTLFRVDEKIIRNEAELTKEAINNAKNISLLNDEEKTDELTSRLLLNKKLNYHNIKVLKDKIRKELEEL